MSKETDLNAFADSLRRFVDQEIPTVAEWNVNPDLLDAITRTIGTYFTDVEAAHAALVNLFNVDHDDASGKNPPALEWVPEAAAPTFFDGTSFTLEHDRTAEYRVGERVRVHQGAGGTAYLVVAITGSAYTGGAGDFTKLTVATAAGLPPLLSGSQKLVAIDRALAIDSIRRVGGFDLVDGAINDPRILADEVVTGPKLHAGSVDRTKIADGEVVYGKIGPSAVHSNELALWGPPGTGVLTAHLGDQCISAAKLGNGQVIAQHIGAEAVRAGHIGTGQVLSQHIYDGQVLTRHIAAQQINGGHIAPGQIGTAQIGDQNVTRFKLSPLNYQNGRSNLVFPNTYEQMGWNFATLDTGSSGVNFINIVTVTFPVAFANILNIVCTPIGFKIGADPTHMNDVQGYDQPPSAGVRLTAPSGTTTPFYNVPHVMPAPTSISVNGFVALISPSSTSNNWKAGDRVVFFWRAVGY